MTIAALTALDKATIALAIVTGGLVLVSLFQLILLGRSEGRRQQPVALAHRSRARNLDGVFGVHLTNEGTGTAFNVRFGVRLDGTEYPAGEGRGRRYLVPAGRRVSDENDFDVRVPIAPYALQRGGRNVDDRAVFYARYENAFGRTWESANPADPLADFSIRRTRFVRLHDWRQRRRRERDERIVLRRMGEEAEVELDMSRLTSRQRWRRRLGR